MSRCSSRKGTPNRQFCDYIEHGIGRSTRKSQSGHATSDSVADLLGTISEEHAEKSTGSDTEEPSSTQNRDEQHQSRGIGDSQQSILDSQEVQIVLIRRRYGQKGNLAFWKGYIRCCHGF